MHSKHWRVLTSSSASDEQAHWDGDYQAIHEKLQCKQDPESLPWIPHIVLRSFRAARLSFSVKKRVPKLRANDASSSIEEARGEL